jgi:hypothetical protein
MIILFHYFLPKETGDRLCGVNSEEVKSEVIEKLAEEDLKEWSKGKGCF